MLRKYRKFKVYVIFKFTTEFDTRATMYRVLVHMYTLCIHSIQCTVYTVECTVYTLHIAENIDIGCVYQLIKKT